jgi:hypothetical protein
MTKAHAMTARRGRTAASSMDQISLAPLLAMLAPHLPPTIVSPSAVARMQAAAGPLFPVSGIGFESRLSGDPSQVDLCMRLMPEDGSAAILGGWHPAHALATPLADDPYWQRLARLCRLLWSSDEALLKPFVNRIGLELDSAHLDGACARPSIAFFDLPDTKGADGAGLVRTMTDIVLPLALERAVSDAQRRRIAEVVATAAPVARLRHIGAALQRPDPAIRLVFAVQLDRIAECLALLGFGPRAEPIGRAAAAIGDNLSEIALQVDVSEALGPRVGIEFHASQAQDWAALLKRLTMCRLCTAERAVALAGWQGAPKELQEGTTSNYTSELPHEAARLREGLPVRLLSHVKLSFTPEGDLGAKVYLYAGFMWRRVA